LFFLFEFRPADVKDMHLVAPDRQRKRPSRGQGGSVRDTGRGRWVRGGWLRFGRACSAGCCCCLLLLLLLLLFLLKLGYLLSSPNEIAYETVDPTAAAAALLFTRSPSAH
jgi:hypothetical protein